MKLDTEVLKLQKEDIISLAGFFDLLAQYDFEDKKKEALEAGSLDVQTDKDSTSDAPLISSVDQNILDNPRAGSETTLDQQESLPDNQP